MTPAPLLENRQEHGKNNRPRGPRRLLAVPNEEPLDEERRILGVNLGQMLPLGGDPDEPIVVPVSEVLVQDMTIGEVVDRLIVVELLELASPQDGGRRDELLERFDHQRLLLDLGFRVVFVQDGFCAVG
jgi:hypothetical protein